MYKVSYEINRHSQIMSIIIITNLYSTGGISKNAHKHIVVLQERSKSEMRTRHELERDKLAQRLDLEAKQEERKTSSDTDKEREKLLREKKTKQAAELAARKDLTQDEMAAVSYNYHLSLSLNGYYLY